MSKKVKSCINITGFEITVFPDTNSACLKVYFTGGSGKVEVSVENYEDQMQTVKASEKSAKLELFDFQMPELETEDDYLGEVHVSVSQTGGLADIEGIDISLDEVAKNGNYLSVCW